MRFLFEAEIQAILIESRWYGLGWVEFLYKIIMSSEQIEKTLTEINRAKGEIPAEIQQQLEERLAKLTGPISKNHKKRIIKELIYESKKDEHQEKKRERRKRALANRKAQGIKKTKITVQEKMGIHIILDLEFNHLMTAKELLSTASQCQHAYADCRRQEIGTHLYLTSVDDAFREYLFKKCTGYENWKLTISPSHFTEFIRLAKENSQTQVPSKICYLSADSENDITSLDQDTFYVIGALVDRNRYPNLCLDKAKELGIPHARLPLAKFVQFQTRKVLTINQVVRILAIYSNTNSWEQAIVESIPARKQGVLVPQE